MRRSVRLLAVLAASALAVPLAHGSQAGASFTYTAYEVGMGATTGEPSIGYHDGTDSALYVSGLKTIRMHWDSKNRLTKKDVSVPDVPETLDPIGWSDPVTHRMFVSQLYLACSFSSFSDDGGESWDLSEGCGPDVLLDHQTVGGGPYRTEVKPVTAGISGYPHAVYYCAQNGYSGTCARSDDGGQTFLPGVPAYNTPANTNGGADPYGGSCSAIHGHIQVAPDGVVYLPLKGCGGDLDTSNLTNSEFFGGGPSVSVSEDNGQTWTVRRIPGGHNQDESDPSLAADKASTIYMGWQDGFNYGKTDYGVTSAAKIAVSKDHGKTWSKPYDVSKALGIKNVQFPEVIAGDAGRAAFAFIGTKGVGDDQHNGFVGEWHLYVATTLDGGKTWKTVDTTPKDPVQRGCISLQGTSNKTVLDTEICSQRNLLDFNGITLDKQGRVLVAYSDGCTGDCVTNPKSGSKGAKCFVMRQTTGPLLYKKPRP